MERGGERREENGGFDSSEELSLMYLQYQKEEACPYTLPIPSLNNHSKNMFKNSIGSSVLRAHRHMLSKRLPLRYTSYCSLHLLSPSYLSYPLPFSYSCFLLQNYHKMPLNTTKARPHNRARPRDKEDSERRDR